MTALERDPISREQSEDRDNSDEKMKESLREESRRVMGSTEKPC